MKKHTYQSSIVHLIWSTMHGTKYLILLLALLAAVPVYGEKREECELCGMWIDQYMRTRHVLHLKDQTTKTFCSLACTAKFLQNKDNEKEILSIEVADFRTKELIDTGKASYLEGSDVPGVMSQISRIAFSSLKEAKEFQKDHGGTIVTFKEALKNQSKH